MPMRALACGLALGLLLSLSPTLPASAAIKAGDKCSKLKSTAIASGKKYTCIKSGGKLLWSKGVTVKVPAPQVTPTPTPTPKSLTPLEIMYLDFYSRFLTASRSVGSQFNFVLCPNIDQSMADLIKRNYIDASSFWERVYRAKSRVNWLLMTEKDWDCWYEYTAKFEGPNSASRVWNNWNKVTGLFNGYQVTDKMFTGYGTGVREGGIFAQYNLIGSNYTNAPTPLVVHHEAVHIYQSQLMSDNHLTSKASTLACWFTEGQANLFGAPIALKGDPTSYRETEKRLLLGVYPNAAIYKKDDWMAVLQDLKKNRDFCFNKRLGYSLGWFALEWTYLNHSIEQMHSFLESITKGSTWEQAIESVLKMNEQSYFANIAAYLADELY